MTKVFGSFLHHHGLHYAAGTGLRSSLALFPLLLAAVTLLRGTGDLDGLVHALDVLARTQAIPDESLHALSDQLERLDEPTTSQLTGGVLALALGIWSAAAAVRTLSAGLNECLGLTDHRPFAYRFAVSLGLAGVVSALALSALFIVVFGDGIGDRLRETLHDQHVLSIAWTVIRLPLVLTLVVAYFSILYALVPADRRRRRWSTPGLWVAVALWLVFAFAFSAYTDAIAKGGALYGTFAGFVALQLYLYWSAAIVLLGAEVDRELGTRAGAAERMQRRILRWRRR